MVNRRYIIGNTHLEIKIDRDILDDKRYLLFDDKTSKKADIFIEFNESESLPCILGANLVREKDAFFEEYLIDGKYIRVYIHKYYLIPYAVLREVEENHFECIYLKKYSNSYMDMNGIFSNIAFERVMIKNNNLVFHASLIDYKGKGILFSGPSGIGKSTQADLWEKYGEAEVINGDKVIINKIDDTWYGYGSPFAGSSSIYKNKRVKIDTIVFLEQANEQCVITKVNGLEAVKKIFSQTIVNMWNEEFVTRVFNLVEAMVKDINILNMYALKDKKSVDCLKMIIDEKR